MGYLMHLHGHKFWVLGSGSGSFPCQSVVEAPTSIISLHDPPYRDTANLPSSGWLATHYVTDNPGAWILHCHIQWHIVTGMALVSVEGEDQLPSLIEQSGNFRNQPAEPSPSGIRYGGMAREFVPLCIP
ncbi:multicopper oxidase-domain-containing protein [Aspergillus alliaceus]|uniref:multicopper oxidase-domain-containing protein n=1 Tax=Petromyces alliaceus TaxID=209559 RepID=UPI0012A4AFEE|nr:multicopper oxidase-domain-containing protein [Aspergillus alliaceus]KAB8234233.1 multicopper oxidase-domain-containing protein [Aspergillus alliaceus]